MNMRRVVPVLVATLFTVWGLTALPAEAQSYTPERYVELLRSDIRTAKVEILTEALDLSNTDAEAFWPIYREYETELSKLGDRRLNEVKRFAENYGSLTPEQVDGFAKEWFSLRNDRLKLRKKYFKRVSKATSSLVAARFVQIDDVIATLIDLQVAAELPLIE